MNSPTEFKLRQEYFRMSPQICKPKRYDRPTRRLALAILVQALRDFVAVSKNPEWEEWQQDAVHWFFSMENRPGSFQWVCDVLRIDSIKLRRWVKRCDESSEKSLKKLARKFRNYSIPH